MIGVFAVAHLNGPSFIVLTRFISQTPVAQSGGQTEWCGSLETWRWPDDNMLLKITSHQPQFHAFWKTPLAPPASRPRRANQTCDKSLRVAAAAAAAAATQTYWPVPSLARFICSPRRSQSEPKQTGVSLTGCDGATAQQPLSARSSLTPLFIWTSLALAQWSGLLLTQNQIKPVISRSAKTTQHETSCWRVHLYKVRNTLLKHANNLKVTLELFFPNIFWEQKQLATLRYR